jgi:hypothetical protein
MTLNTNWNRSVAIRLKVFIALVVFFGLGRVSEQNALAWSDISVALSEIKQTPTYIAVAYSEASKIELNYIQASDSLIFDPKKALTQSLILPGWGQVQNQQAWKIPIIYGAFTGAGFYLSDLTKRYHDYRAAVYNISRGADSDLKFGETPSYIPPNANVVELQRLRDSYRNKRDFAFLIVGILYGLNALDAYVFAHMRSFDVSDDLSARIIISPAMSPMALGVEGSGVVSPEVRVRISIR